VQHRWNFLFRGCVKVAYASFMQKLESPSNKLRLATFFVWGLMVIQFAIHVVLGNRYGFHRDELYFIECGRRLAFGYVDHPPLIPWLAALMEGLFGTHMLAIRIPAMVASAVLIQLTFRLGLAIGSGPLAAAAASFCVSVSPFFLRFGGILNIPIVETTLWTAGFLGVARVLRERRPALWYGLGLVVGIGFLTKYTILVWACGVSLGFLLTGNIWPLRQREFWYGVGIVGAFALPNLIWQVNHDWPVIPFVQEMAAVTLAEISRSALHISQVVYFGPLMTPVWLAGLYFLCRSSHQNLRPLLITVIFVVAVFTMTLAKPYYLAGLFPLLFCAGAWQASRWWRQARRSRPLFAVGGVLAVVSSLFTLSLSLPLLPLEQLDHAITKVLGGQFNPLHFTHELHDEYGWPELANAVAKVVADLPPETRNRLAVVADNYGQAAALNIFAKDRLPEVTSGHMNYYLWGPPSEEHTAILAVGRITHLLAEICPKATTLATFTHPVGLPHEFALPLPITLCESVSTPVAKVWPLLRSYHHERLNRPFP
jgi:Dolichyl-phosphate-mannose-protein mannosyltransferase